ncbi:MAG: FGGY-family carbohydrate kinase, partial [Planctomycetota bacterium]
PGEVAATAGTSGVVYGISDQTAYDPKSRVNIFLHVNNADDAIRNGVLLCVNGTGRLNSWLKHNVMAGRGDYPEMDYPEMNELAQKAPIGADGLVVLPYGNGAERTLENNNIGAAIANLDLNTHDISHILRAAQEGIVFALNYGIDVMKEMGIQTHTIRAGKANMFLSPLFAQTFATLTGATVELYNTDGAQGACRGAGIGAGIYTSPADAFETLAVVETITPNDSEKDATTQAYQTWSEALNKQLK